MQRPPVTDAERHALKNLEVALTESETFCCTGKARYARVSDATLMYKTAAGAKAFPIQQATDGALDALHRDCTASRVGQDLLMDDASHHGPPVHELPAVSFGLNFNPLEEENGILAAMSSFYKDGLVARMQKLRSFSFTKGGHVKAQSDGPTDPNLVGTLLIGLHTPPGGLLLQRDKDKVDIDWNDGLNQPPQDTLTLPWTFFYSGVEHKIQLVKPGHQLILAYDIFRSKTVRYSQEPVLHAMDICDTRFFKAFDAMLKNPQLLGKGGVLAFGLTYSYPAPAKEVKHTFLYNAVPKPEAPEIPDTVRIVSTLKGSDAILYRVLTESGLKTRLQAVYLEQLLGDDYDENGSSDGWNGDDGSGNGDEDGHEGGGEKNVKLLDEFTCFQKDGYRQGESGYEGDVLLMADSFSGFQTDPGIGEVGAEQSQCKVLQQELGAKIGWDVIWVKTPVTFYEADSFTRRESVEHNVVSAAFVVHVPRVVDGRRLDA